MSKTVNVVVVALQTVVTAASNVAGSSAALTAAACHALTVGAHVSDVITAVQAGYEEKGQDLPAGMSSNLKRLAACDNELIAAVGASGYAMNNKLLELFKVPKLTNRGAAAKTATTNSGAAVDPMNPGGIIPKSEHSPIHAWLLALTTMGNGANIVRDASNNTMSAADAAAFQKVIDEAKAIVGKYTAAKTAAK